MFCSIVFGVLCIQQESAPSHLLTLPEPSHVRLPKNFQYDDRVDYGVALGGSVGAGDVNGDGIADIITGAPFLGKGTNYGGVFIFNGATYEFMALLTLDDCVEYEFLGWTVGAADFDHDGRSEVVVGSYRRTVVFRGGSLTKWKQLARPTEDMRIADCNGDGELDVVVAARLGDEAGGVYFGPTLDTSISLPVLPIADGGKNVAVGDLDNDGINDVLLANRYTDEGKGRCWFTLGPSFASVQGEIKDPEPTRDGLFGKSLVTGDFTGDGLTDVVVTSSITPCPYDNLCRDTLLFSGPDFTKYRQVTDRYDSKQWALGVYASDGDVNHDGQRDLITVGFMSFSGLHAVPEFFAYLGPGLEDYVRFHASDRDARDHASVASAFLSVDLDGDGREELLVGDPTANVFQGVVLVDTGVVHVFDFSTADPFSTYGYGSIGTGGCEPHLSASGTARLGSTFTLSVTGARGGAVASLISGSATTSRSLCEQGFLLGHRPFLRVDADTSSALALSGPAGAPGAGSATVRLLIPPDPALMWQPIYYQVLVDDPGAPCGIAVTQGLQVSPQP
ncbi:MAG: FG-GAP-like repeat-containing protein [Planctomycetota bacterium]